MMNITDYSEQPDTSETFLINSIGSHVGEETMTFVQHSIDDAECEVNGHVKEEISHVHEGDGNGHDQLDDNVDDEQLSESDEHIIKQLLMGIEKATVRRLNAINTKLEGININTQYLEDKLEQVFQHFQPSLESSSDLSGQQNIYKRSNLESFDTMDEMTQQQEFDDCFESCYLGDTAKEHMRVRAPLSADELMRIEAACATPEELALSLFDLLLDREALDDLSEHRQADLDLLIIHAIHLHLMYVFNISDDNWNEIQTELLSRCPSSNRTQTCELTVDTNSFNGHEFGTEYCPTSSSSDKAFHMDVTDLDLVD